MLPTAEEIGRVKEMGGDPVWRDIEDLPEPDEAAAEWFAEVQKDFVAWWKQNHQSQ